ncbi:MAG: polyphosphate kinase 2 family protein [Paraglaciecola sp.]|nr:polyphosphate kinase 2 family protein [Paraglaciecola sp.]NCT49453.1 polyphosphate kinase 2 family protein [Paraglaciecola sp.]
MKIDCDAFRVKPDSNLDLSQWPTIVDPYYTSKSDYRKKLTKNVKHLSQLQRLLYATNQHSVLLIFQAMDAAGKDGAIRHVLSGINPQGCQVTSFKHPSATELDHDFMWRTTRALPERGRIGIFNRSYYEEVLIVRVHPEILAGQGLPEPIRDHDELWQERYQSIQGFEQHMQRNGTRIIKFFLHLSKEEQRLRFLQRIDKPNKNWKFSEADIKERQFWPQYMQAYQQAINATSSKAAPWYIIPADDKKNARLIMAQIVRASLTSLDMHYPQSDEKRVAELQAFRQQLAK